MEIKVYTKADEQTVIDLWAEMAKGMSAIVDDRINIREKLTAPSQLFFVANVEEIAVGTALACITDGVGHLDYVAVKEGHQRKGIGSQLVRQAEQTLADMGCASLSIDFEATNEVLMSFLVKLGFYPQGIISLGKNINGGSNTK